MSLAIGLLVGLPLAVAADGTFRGTIAAPPADEPSIKGWIFVEGRNRMLRRVEVAHAEVVYGEEVPASERQHCNSDCLSAGQEVRITAHQDPAGEWHAKRVEILRLATPTKETGLESTLYQTLLALGFSIGNQSGQFLHRTFHGINLIFKC